LWFCLVADTQLIKLPILSNFLQIDISSNFGELKEEHQNIQLHPGMEDMFQDTLTQHRHKPFTLISEAPRELMGEGQVERVQHQGETVGVQQICELDRMQSHRGFSLLAVVAEAGPLQTPESEICQKRLQGALVEGQVLPECQKGLKEDMGEVLAQRFQGVSEGPVDHPQVHRPRTAFINQQAAAEVGEVYTAVAVVAEVLFVELISISMVLLAMMVL
jgi:hypothetical protein